MVEQNIHRLDATFSALGNPTRRALLAQLTKGTATVNELAAPFDMTLMAISKHLKVLEKAGLITRRIEGRSHIISLNAASMVDAFEWMSFYQDFWGDSFDALKQLLIEDED